MRAFEAIRSAGMLQCKIAYCIDFLAYVIITNLRTAQFIYTSSKFKYYPEHVPYINHHVNPLTRIWTISNFNKMLFLLTQISAKQIYLHILHKKHPFEYIKLESDYAQSLVQKLQFRASDGSRFLRLENRFVFFMWLQPQKQIFQFEILAS